jgi:hypothetical protein
LAGLFLLVALKGVQNLPLKGCIIQVVFGCNLLIICGLIAIFREVRNFFIWTRQRVFGVDAHWPPIEAKKHTAGAKAHAYFAGFIAGDKSPAYPNLQPLCFKHHRLLCFSAIMAALKYEGPIPVNRAFCLLIFTMA